MQYLFHITSQAQWQQAQEMGFYRPFSLETEGFIHASTEKQVLGVANQFYQGREDLVLLKLDPEKITSEIRWEAPIHPKTVENPQLWSSDLFPHLYGVLNLDAVVAVTVLKLNQQGYFTDF